jgi:nucleotide-binding universal stress UspA family protein
MNHEEGASMFRRIMVPLDGSHYAVQAIPVAACIARAAGAEIVLACVAHLGFEYSGYLGPVPLSQEVLDRQYDELRTYLEAIASREELIDTPRG